MNLLNLPLSTLSHRRKYAERHAWYFNFVYISQDDHPFLRVPINVVVQKKLRHAGGLRRAAITLVKGLKDWSKSLTPSLLTNEVRETSTYINEWDWLGRRISKPKDNSSQWKRSSLCIFSTCRAFVTATQIWDLKTVSTQNCKNMLSLIVLDKTTVVWCRLTRFPEVHDYGK